ncbi:unnamed protein product [Rhizophagus irregularis]|nr:unnamed protein product [Rhizophagus irregularis]
MLHKKVKKKVFLTNAQKFELCLYANNNKRTRAQYANWVEQKWGVRVDETTITRILQNKDKRLSTEVIHPEQKRHRPVTFPEHELALKEFVLCYQHRAILSDAILIEKAKLLASGLGIPENVLQFSSGWLQALPLLREKCANYPLERIYNMDETGLFYRLEPDRTLATKHLHGRKKNKERLSVALCSNADGSHKLNPLIIRKFANLRCFKNINIHFDHQVAQKHGGQRVLLLLDNCTSHKLEGLTLSHVDVHFLPPNTTQRFNQWILESSYLLKNTIITIIFGNWILEQIEAGEFIQDLKMDVLQAIQYIIKSWNEVTAETIYNCWNHTGILPDTEFLDNIEDDDSIFNEISEILETLNLPNSMDAEEFLNIPEENIVYEIPEDNQIITELVEMFKKKSDENTDDLDEMDDSTEVVPVSIKVALKSLKKLHTFLLQQEDTNEYIKLINTIEKFIKRKQTQTTIYQYFN